MQPRGSRLWSLLARLSHSAARRRWEDEYEEAVQWRDWMTCDLLLEERDESDWFAKERQRRSAEATPPLKGKA